MKQSETWLPLIICCLITLQTRTWEKYRVVMSVTYVVVFFFFLQYFKLPVFYTSNVLVQIGKE